MPYADVTERIIGAAIHVHRRVGPGLFESVYERCLCAELQARSISFQRQVPIPLIYEQLEIPDAYRADLIVENKVLVELKAIDNLGSVQTTQLLTYVKLSKLTTGLLINFNSPLLRDGIRTVINKEKVLLPAVLLAP
jgi:GxxExxY protein